MSQVASFACTRECSTLEPVLDIRLQHLLTQIFVFQHERSRLGPPPDYRSNLAFPVWPACELY
jgi:hypothetical protein